MSTKEAEHHCGGINYNEALRVRKHLGEMFAIPGVLKLNPERDSGGERPLPTQGGVDKESLAEDDYQYQN